MVDEVGVFGQGGDLFRGETVPVSNAAPVSTSCSNAQKTELHPLSRSPSSFPSGGGASRS